MSSQITLKNITSCSKEEQYLLRQVRNQESVRKSMYTDHEISEEEHGRWLEKCYWNDKNAESSIQSVFIVFIDHKVSGVVSVNAIDRQHKKADWAFYLDENLRGGLGAILEYNFIDFLFNQYDIEKLNCEVIETNPSVVKLHKKFGFIEEGFRRSNIIKNEKRIGVHFLGLTKEDWSENKLDFYKKYKKFLNNHAVNIKDK